MHSIMPRKSQYSKKLEYNNTYNRNNYRSFSVRFNINSEKDIIDWLEKQEGIKSYVEGLIRADMKKKEKKAEKKAAKKAKK